ncbi:hypothetical protein EES39_18050 [Streptomyces sp. ADI92-24]|nr:hypothetical protein EES39_18050 [Streptomyces sp. ADI92-24]
MRPSAKTPSKHTRPPGRSRRNDSARQSRLSIRSPSQKTRSYPPSASRGSTSRARPGMKRARLAAKPAARKASRANCWRSGSGSTVVSTPSGLMPCSRKMPDTPVPVPISATALASVVAASRRSAAPVPGDTERSPASRARSRAQRSASSSATKASANAQLVCRLAVMALSCPRSWRNGDCIRCTREPADGTRRYGRAGESAWIGPADRVRRSWAGGSRGCPRPQQEKGLSGANGRGGYGRGSTGHHQSRQGRCGCACGSGRSAVALPQVGG